MPRKHLSINEVLEFFKNNFQVLKDHETLLIKTVEDYLDDTHAKKPEFVIFKEKNLDFTELAKNFYFLHHKKQALMDCQRILENPKAWHDHTLRKFTPLLLEIMDKLGIPHEPLPENF